MSRFFSRVTAFFRAIPARAAALWRRFRSLKIWQQVLIVVALLAIVAGIIALIRSNSAAPSTADQAPTVTLSSVAELSGAASGGSVVGSVRSLAEADILAQSSGTVTAVHTTLGASVPAGFIIAELDNASQRAAVLQAQGGYDAAVAARGANSLPEAETGARNAYRSAYTTLDTVLENDINAFFGPETPVGPQLLINAGPSGGDSLSRARRALSDTMSTFQSHQGNAATGDPTALLAEAQTVTDQVSAFVDTLAQAANTQGSGATPAQLASLAAARASIQGVETSLSAARDAYRSRSTSATSGADASVETALGGLRAAQASLEKTFVRAPIAGVVNFLPIHVGDYATQLEHVATVAQNGSLEIVTNVSESDRALLTVGQKVTIEGSEQAIITSIAPALDPTTKQIEVHLALTGTGDLVNGQSVRITLPGAVLPVATTATTTSTGPTLLPLAAVKLGADSRIVFSVAADNTLVAHTVSIGNVHGDRIEVTTPLDPALLIVADARGLSEGEKVQVASSTTP